MMIPELSRKSATLQPVGDEIEFDLIELRVLNVIGCRRLRINKHPRFIHLVDRDHADRHGRFDEPAGFELTEYG